MNWQKERFSQKQLTSESFDNDKKLTLKSFFAFCSVFFLQRPTVERWKRLRDRHSVRFPKYSSVTLRAKTYSALSFDVFNMANICFNFLGNPLLYVIVFVSQQKLFVDACQMTVKSRALHLISDPPNWRKPYNKNLISLVFSVRTVNYGSSANFSISITVQMMSIILYRQVSSNWSPVAGYKELLRVI